MFGGTLVADSQRKHELLPARWDLKRQSIIQGQSTTMGSREP